MSKLRQEFETRFDEFDRAAEVIQIFQNPFKSDIDKVPAEMQLESHRATTNDSLKTDFQKSDKEVSGKLPTARMRILGVEMQMIHGHWSRSRARSRASAAGLVFSEEVSALTRTDYTRSLTPDLDLGCAICHLLPPVRFK
ncbi:hypothetical protein J6590_086551 [Homalodisca vitripennis]|nr:hypothetical protein J6590_086551 [Homalodisca vitripennis]